MTVVKKRMLPSGGNTSTIVRYTRPSANANWVRSTILRGRSNTFMGKQITASESHSWPPKPGTKGDVGGPFSTTRVQADIGQIVFRKSIPHRSSTSGSFQDRKEDLDLILETPVELDFNLQPQWPTSLQSADADLEVAGATAISRVKPTSSSAELSVALGETYKDGLPALLGHQTWRDRTLRARNAGDEYLNVQFGWVPLVNDVLSFGNAVTHSRDILSQYRADRGNTIRRRYDFPVETVTSPPTLLSSNKLFVTNAGITGNEIPSSTGGKWYKTTISTKRRWFSGAFVYGVPQDSTPFGTVHELGAEADRLFGVSLTPDVLWNLSPWSWAIDWFTNTGDVLSTIGDMVSQGLVMQYGYMMEHTINEIIYTLEGATAYGEPVQLLPSTIRVETKVRKQANPFGFGISWDGLSSAQLAILGALGLSRSS